MMHDKASFVDVLEAADSLSLEEQETLVDILHKRLVERHRTDLAREIQHARDEFKKGGCKSATPSEIVKEILS